RNIILQELKTIPISNNLEFIEVYERGNKNRRVGATILNPNSSRSHAIITLIVKHQQKMKPYDWIIGKLNLCDLAGSEDNRKTGNTGERMTESKNINLSLFTLRKVVHALNSGHHRIPYRDSKLTRILQDSLGGKSRATMIANISPSTQHFYDSYKTLQFAMKSKAIINNPIPHNERIEKNERLSNERFGRMGSVRM